MKIYKYGELLYDGPIPPGVDSFEFQNKYKIDLSAEFQYLPHNNRRPTHDTYGIWHKAARKRLEKTNSPVRQRLRHRRGSNRANQKRIT